MQEIVTKWPIDVLPDLFTEHRWERLRANLQLSPRQFEVARLLCRGLTKSEIAFNLGIAEHTVHMHQRKVYERLGTKSKIGLVVHLVLLERDIR